MRLAAAAQLLALVAALPAAAQSSAASDVEEGQALYLRADFRGAAAAFDRALSSPSLGAAQAREAHRHLAALLLAVGTESEARAHVAAAVALDPSVTPPEGAPAELAAMFDDARGEPASIAIDTDGALTAGTTTEIRARVSPAPDRLFDAVRLRCDDGVSGPTDHGSPPPEATLELTPGPGATAVECVAAALSRGGAELVTAARRFALDATEVGVTEPSTGTEDDDGMPLWPFIVGGIAVAAAAAVVIALVVVSSSGSTEAQFGSTTVDGW